MAYRIVIVKSAAKQLSALSDLLKEKIISKIDSLAVNPRPYGIEKLSNRQNEYRVRVGDYRIVYSIFDKLLIVEVVDIDHRKQVYR